MADPSQRGGGQPRSKEAAPGELLPIENYLTSADQVLSYQGDHRLSLPKNGNNEMEITINRSGFFAPVAGNKLTLDASTVEVTAAEIFRDKPFNERVAGSIKALHLGNVYGQFSKLVYFLPV